MNQDNLQKDKTSGETEVTVQKMAEGSVEGQVSCIEGPVTNASVSIGMISTFTDATGNFVLEHLPPGIGKVRVNSPLSRFYDASTDVLVEADQRKNLPIFLNEITGVLEGTITDEIGKPLVGAEVSGMFRLGKEAITTKTDEKGDYIFQDIPRGVYYIRAKAQGFMTEGADVNITAGGNIESNFKLKAANLSISGIVTAKEGTVVDGELYLMRKGVIVTRTNISKGSVGKYSFPDLVPDYYEIGIIAPGYFANGWGGKVEKPEVVNFKLEVMPETNADSSFVH
ncbi:MAG: carboxypeptidase regulatory-like domain-containing protein [Nitrososphaerota archaeon]|nr:carboxypeptidase regulatory-like domain-containing protein [Nitrososphaerota archaeon]MDG6924171.1 carboxypeptidase regulatory-like domain-containing protein [Nitrososphaerota archaeon]